MFEKYLNMDRRLMDLLGDAGGAGGGAGEGGDKKEGGGEGGSKGGAIPPDYKSLVASLPKDLQEDPSMKSITSLEGLAKSFIHAQKAVGKDKIVLPDKHATRDDYRALLGKLGVPEKVEDYKVTKAAESKITDDFMKKFSETAHKAGMLPWQAEEMLNWYENEVKTATDSSDVEIKAEIQKGVDALKKEWGQGFKAQVARANVTLKELLPDQADRQSLIDMGFGNNPHLIRLLANASKLLKEDVFVGKGGGLSVMTSQDALSKARQIMGDKDHPYRNTSHPNHLAAKKEVASLYKQAFPENSSQPD